MPPLEYIQEAVANKDAPDQIELRFDASLSPDALDSVREISRVAEEEARRFAAIKMEIVESLNATMKSALSNASEEESQVMRQMVDRMAESLKTMTAETKDTVVQAVREANQELDLWRQKAEKTRDLLTVEEQERAFRRERPELANLPSPMIQEFLQGGAGTPEQWALALQSGQVRAQQQTHGMAPFEDILDSMIHTSRDTAVKVQAGEAASEDATIFSSGLKDFLSSTALAGPGSLLGTLSDKGAGGAAMAVGTSATQGLLQGLFSGIGLNPALLGTAGLGMALAGYVTNSVKTLFEGLGQDQSMMERTGWTREEASGLAANRHFSFGASNLAMKDLEQLSEAIVGLGVSAQQAGEYINVGAIAMDRMGLTVSQTAQAVDLYMRRMGYTAEQFSMQMGVTQAMAASQGLNTGQVMSDILSAGQAGIQSGIPNMEEAAQYATLSFSDQADAQKYGSELSQGITKALSGYGSRRLIALDQGLDPSAFDVMSGGDKFNYTMQAAMSKLRNVPSNIGRGDQISRAQGMLGTIGLGELSGDLIVELLAQARGERTILDSPEQIEEKQQAAEESYRNEVVSVRELNEVGWKDEMKHLFGRGSSLANLYSEEEAARAMMEGKGLTLRHNLAFLTRNGGIRRQAYDSIMTQALIYLADPSEENDADIPLPNGSVIKISQLVNEEFTDDPDVWLYRTVGSIFGMDGAKYIIPLGEEYGYSITPEQLSGDDSARTVLSPDQIITGSGKDLMQTQLPGSENQVQLLPGGRQAIVGGVTITLDPAVSNLGFLMKLGEGAKEYNILNPPE